MMPRCRRRISQVQRFLSQRTGDTMSHDRPLRRSTHDAMIAGVCAGLAEHFDLPASRVRIIYVLCSVLSAAFPGILVYILLWFLIPKDSAY